MDIFDNENKMCDFMSSDFENFKYSPLFEDNMNSPFDIIAESPNFEVDQSGFGERIASPTTYLTRVEPDSDTGEVDTLESLWSDTICGGALDLSQSPLSIIEDEDGCGIGSEAAGVEVGGCQSLQSSVQQYLQGNIVLNDRMISAIPVSPRKVVVKREHSYSSNHHHLAAAKSSALLLTNEPECQDVYMQTPVFPNQSVLLTTSSASLSSGSASLLTTIKQEPCVITCGVDLTDSDNEYIDIVGGINTTQVYTVKSESHSMEQEIDVLTVAADAAGLNFDIETSSASDHISMIHSDDYNSSVDNMPLTPPGSSCSNCSDDTLSSSEIACSNGHHRHTSVLTTGRSNATSHHHNVPLQRAHVAYVGRNFHSISGTTIIPGSGIGGTTSNGILLLTEEERRTLVSEGYPVPGSKTPLTKHDERNLKKVRRKIKNKISAQESRRKKKEYLETLEKRLELYNRDNCDLKKQVQQLQNNNSSLTSQLNKLQNLVASFTPKVSPQANTCLAAVVLSFALFLGAWSPLLAAVGNSPSPIGSAPLAHSGRGVQFNARNVNRDIPDMQDAATFQDVRSRVLMPDYDPIADLTNYHEATLPKVATILQAWFYPVNHDSLRPEQTSDNASEGQDKVKPPQYILNHAQ